MLGKWRGLFVGGRPDSFSLGRVAFWLMLGLSVWFWLTQSVDAFPPSLENALTYVLAYNFGGKMTGQINQFMRHRKGNNDLE